MISSLISMGIIIIYTKQIWPRGKKTLLSISKMRRRIVLILNFFNAFIVCLFPVSASGTPTTLPVEIVIKGIEGDLEKNVRALLSLSRECGSPDLTAESLRLLYKKAPGEIETALQPFGYFKPVISSSLTERNGTYRATFTIEAGPPVHVSQVRVELSGEGSEDVHLQRLVRNFPIRKGDVLRQHIYETGKKDLLRETTSLGYLDASFAIHEIRVDPDAGTATVNLLLDTGTRYRFGRLTFLQNAYNPKYLSRFAPFAYGDPYSNTALLDLEDALTSTNDFALIKIQPDREDALGEYIPVEVELVPKPPNAYTLSVGYGTDTGLRGTAGWEQRRVNAWGHSLRTHLALSETRNTLSAGYSVPLGKPTQESLDIDAAWTQEHIKTSDSEGLTLGLSRKTIRRRWQERLFCNLIHEGFETGEDDRTSTFLIPGGTWSRISSDDPVDPGKGYRLGLTLSGTSEAIGSSTSFIQALGSAMMIRSPWKDGRIHLRGELGMTGVDDFSKLTPSLRFYAGGDQSVRGYSYEGLGPRDDKGDVVGGRYLLVGSLEYMHRIAGNWWGATFYDAGNAMDSFYKGLKQGAGLGVRWMSPVGPVRLDLAFALDEPGTPIRIHFSLGPAL